MKENNFFFHKKGGKDILPLKLSNPFINASKTEREVSLKFLGIIFDLKIFRDSQMQLIENKVSKILGFLIRQNMYSAKIDSRTFILLLFTSS